MSYQAELLSAHEEGCWESFILDQSDSTPSHQIGWRRVIAESFGHETYYLVAKDARGKISAALPLVLVKSRWFGRSLVSMPFLNYGGIVSVDAEAEGALLNRSIQLAKEVGADSLELRYDRERPWRTPVKTNKVAMWLDLPSRSGTLWDALPSKLRSQIRKPIKEGMEIHWGGEDELESFYKVFSINMRDLGTPVYGVQFFSTILNVFKDQARICAVYRDGQPIAAGFFIAFRDRLEIPWASSLQEFNRFSPNMLLYWSALQFACDHGFRVFDFGRSTVGAGTFKFKEQWGAKPVPLYWYYPYVSTNGSLPDANVENPRYKLAIKLWRQLPVWVTHRGGPSIVRGIP